MSSADDTSRVRAGLEQAWSVMALRGLLAIVMGLLMLTRPGTTMGVLLRLLGVYLIFDGTLALLATRHVARGQRRWWPYLAEGLLSIGVGALTFARPAGMALAILAVIAARAIITGVVEIATGVSHRRSGGSRASLLWLGGLASIAFGGLLFVNPAVGALTLVWLTGMYGVVFGISLAAEAFRLRSFAGSRLPSRTH